jgi:hypothetical protein
MERNLTWRNLHGTPSFPGSQDPGTRVTGAIYSLILIPRLKRPFGLQRLCYNKYNTLLAQERDELLMKWEQSIFLAREIV